MEMRHQNRLQRIQTRLLHLQYLEAAKDAGGGVSDGTVVPGVGYDNRLDVVTAFQACDQRLHDTVRTVAGRLHQVIDMIDDQQAVPAFDVFQAQVEAVDPGGWWFGKKSADIEQKERTAKHRTAEALLRAGADEFIHQGGLSSTRLTSHPHIVDASGRQYGVQFRQFGIQSDITDGQRPSDAWLTFAPTLAVTVPGGSLISPEMAVSCSA